MIPPTVRIFQIIFSISSFSFFEIFSIELYFPTSISNDILITVVGLTIKVSAILCIGVLPESIRMIAKRLANMIFSVGVSISSINDCIDLLSFARLNTVISLLNSFSSRAGFIFLLET